jgi:hypothetical protein
MDQTSAVSLVIILLSLAVFYDQITKRIPTRKPRSGYGLIPAVEYDSPPTADGVE